MIFLERNHANDRFLVMNTILARTEIFSEEDIIEELRNKGVNIPNVVRNCLESLMDNGLIYEIGSRYMVKNRQKRWRLM